MTRLKFPLHQIEFECRSGTDFLEFSAKHPDAPLKFGCKNGHCGTCAIKILEGQHNLTKQSSQERQTLKKIGLDETHYRLACQCAFNGNVTIS